MSQENVELLRRIYEGFAKGDFEPLFAFLHPEIEWDVSRRLMDPEIFRGREEVRKLQELRREVWSDQRAEPEDFIDAGDTVVVPIRVVNTGRGSGLVVAARAAWVYELRDGMMVRATVYQSTADALKAVGLAE